MTFNDSVYMSSRLMIDY